MRPKDEDSLSRDGSDTAAAFLAISWTASLLEQPDLVITVPASRKLRRLPDTEDSLFADTLKSDRTVQSCVTFYRQPNSPDTRVDAVNTLLLVGNAMNGHSGIMHGGIVATIIDEAMGILQSINSERAFKSRATESTSSFTVELKVTYLRPVYAPGAVLVTAKTVKKDARKEWILSEVLQNIGGEMVVCSRGEALFVQPKVKPSL